MPNYGNVVLTGNNEFDKNFKLHSADEFEAKEVINPFLISKIIEIKDKLKLIKDSNKKSNYQNSRYVAYSSLLKISIINNSFYIALGGLKLFDINLKKKATESSETITQSLTYLKMLTEIAELI